MSETLKPCPFCGGYARRQTEFMSDGYEYVAVACSKCGAMTPGNYSRYGDQAEWDWNNRVERTCHMELDKAASRAMCGPALRCDACGAAMPAAGTLHYCPSCGAKVTD